MSLDNAFAGIKALIFQLNSDIYPEAERIKGGLQKSNNATFPKDGNFVIMTELEITKSMSILPVYQFDPDTEQVAFLNIESVPFQIDFYGAQGRKAGERFRLACQYLYGNTFLNGYGISVNWVTDLFNLTNKQETLNAGPNERGVYLPRYAARIGLFDNNVLIVPGASFDVVDVNTRFVP